MGFQGWKHLNGYLSYTTCFPVGNQLPPQHLSSPNCSQYSHALQTDMGVHTQMTRLTLHGPWNLFFWEFHFWQFSTFWGLLFPKPRGKKGLEQQLLSTQLPSAEEQSDGHRLSWGAIPNPPRKGRMVEPRLDAPIPTKGQGTWQGGGTAAVRHGGRRHGGCSGCFFFPEETSNGQAVQ